MSNITKSALETSLKKLLKTNRIDKITIRQITDDCGISRAAFYYHFRDIYDLVEWIFVKRFIEPFSRKPDTAPWDKRLTDILDEMYREKDFVYSIYNFVNFKRLQNYLYEFLNNYLYGIIKKKSAGYALSEENKRTIADFYKYSIVGAIFDWLDKGMDISPGALVRKISLFGSGGIDYQIKKFST